MVGYFRGCVGQLAIFNHSIRVNCFGKLQRSWLLWNQLTELIKLRFPIQLDDKLLLSLRKASTRRLHGGGNAKVLGNWVLK